MIVYVRYPDTKVDYVNSLVLDRLIRDRTITEFFRPSERQWVDIVHGRVRRGTPAAYEGAERRLIGLKEG